MTGSARASSSASVLSVGVVIRTLDESELITRCLDTLRAQRSSDLDLDLDIVVVDSGSTDGTLAMARKGGARVVELSPEDFDYSKALNLGIEQVRGEIVVSLSAHAIPLDDRWLERMTSPLADERVAGVASRQVPWPDAPWQEVKRLREQFGEARREYGADDTEEVLFSNAASAIRRAVWEREPFTLPAVEDLEWARRVVATGWTIVYEPDASVYHSHHENARARARRLIDINRVHDADGAARSRRRTVREAAGLLVRDSRAILALDEPASARAGYLRELLGTAWYYVVDFSRAGTTAERRREGDTSAKDSAKRGYE